MREVVMAREGRQKPYYEDEERFGRDYDYPERERRAQEQEPDWETRERLDRYFSRHYGEERPYGERKRPYREEEERYREEEERRRQMLGRDYKPGWGKEDSERAHREERGREGYDREGRYRREPERDRGYLPERAREEYAKRFRPIDYDWEREDFERAKQEQWGREGYGEERHWAEGERRGERGREEWPPMWERSREQSEERWMRGPHAGRGPRGYRRPDDRIYEDVCDRLMRNGEIDARDIEVDVHDAVVTLRGSVNNRQSKYAAEEVSESVFGVKDIRNEIRIESYSPTFTPREPRPGGRPQMVARLSRLMEVFDRNMASIGQVRDIRENDFQLDRRTGMDIFVPFDAIDRIDNRVVLNIEEDRMDRMGWQTTERPRSEMSR